MGLIHIAYTTYHPFRGTVDALSTPFWYPNGRLLFLRNPKGTIAYTEYVLVPLNP